MPPTGDEERPMPAPWLGRALGHPVASGTATIAMGCARLRSLRRGAKPPRYGRSFGGWWARWVESL
jgi:hypothetical protein